MGYLEEDEFALVGFEGGEEGGEGSVGFVEDGGLDGAAHGWGVGLVAEGRVEAGGEG